VTLRFRGRILENREKFEEYLDVYSFGMEDLYNDDDVDDEEGEDYEG